MGRVRPEATVNKQPVVASRQQGVANELVGTTGRVPSKEGAGGAHRGRRHDDGAKRPAGEDDIPMEGGSGDH
jgi:hypothetical protein